MRFERPSRLIDHVGQADGTLQVRLRGDFDLAQVQRVEQVIDEELDPTEVECVIVDLAGVEFLDLAAIRSLLRLHARGRAEGYAVSVVKPRGPASRIFTLTRLGRELATVDAPPELATS